MLDPDAFLRQEVESASPAKLRLMLIRKAIGLCEAIDGIWHAGDFDRASQWSHRLAEILTELLAGVTDASNPAAKAITDLYIFLGKLLLRANQNHDRVILRSIRDVMETEFSTWKLYTDNENKNSAHVLYPIDVPMPKMIQFPDNGRQESYSAAGLNLEA